MGNLHSLRINNILGKQMKQKSAFLLDTKTNKQKWHMRKIWHGQSIKQSPLDYNNHSTHELKHNLLRYMTHNDHMIDWIK